MKVNEVEQRFRACGIPIFVEPDYSTRDIMAVGAASTYENASSPPEWYRINICLDEQLEEAKHLFNDPNYKVIAPVDIAKFDARMDKLGANRKIEWRISNKGFNWIVGIIICGSALWALCRMLLAS